MTRQLRARGGPGRRLAVNGSSCGFGQRARACGPPQGGARSAALTDRWLVDGLAEHKATTRENYTTMVRKQINPAIGSLRLERLSHWTSSRS